MDDPITKERIDRIKEHMKKLRNESEKVDIEKVSFLNCANQLMETLKQARPEERGDKSRKFAIAITETEKLIAYLLTL